MQPEIIVKELARMDRAALEAHFLALGMADRRLRFGALLSDAAVRTYVARIDFDRGLLSVRSGKGSQRGAYAAIA